MAKSRINRVLGDLRQAVLDGEEVSDGQLLEYFLAGSEEFAFEALVHRHGPMVLGVCRRILAHAQDAEDAFQATFLVLARKAAGIWPRAKVGNWLYGVAYRIALKARAISLKRQAREKPLGEAPEPAAPPPEAGPEWLPVLDRELHGLPAKYRVPIVLCDLQGKSQRDAARQLGWPQGTLAGRLSRARVLLGKRLARRRITLTGTALTSALAAHASAEVPATLAQAAVKAAAFATVKQALSGGAISAQVAGLTEGVLTAMMWTNLKAGLILIVALAIVATGITNAFFSASGQALPDKAAEKKINQVDDAQTAKMDPIPAEDKAALVKQRADEESRLKVLVQRNEEQHQLAVALGEGDVEVYVDGDMQKPFFKSAKFSGLLDLGGRRFVVFTQGREKSIIEYARIVAFRVTR